MHEHWLEDIKHNLSYDDLRIVSNGDYLGKCSVNRVMNIDSPTLQLLFVLSAPNTGTIAYHVFLHDAVK